jgi:hypothetical protein
MKIASWLRLLILAAAGTIAGCGGSTSQDEPSEDATVKANMNLLSPRDRKVARAQKVCVVSGNPLGSMGTPFKVEIDGQPVFLCCDGCKDRALEHCDETLARARELRAQGGAKK